MRERSKEELLNLLEEKATPLKWFVATDAFYYNSTAEINKILSHQNLNSLWITSPLSLYRVGKELSYRTEFVVLAPFYPPPEFSELFVVEKLPGRYGVITSQEKESSDLLHAVERKLGLKIHRPSLTLNNLIGARRLKEQIGYMRETLKDEELRVRGVMFVGLPGTGKSYSAKCTAGELGRWLIEFNLSRLMEEERPIERLHSIFEILEDLPPFILWIDEIDKVFTGGSTEVKVLGQLLTIMEEFNKPTGYRGDGFFWATANNVKVIIDRNPEFFRRFDFRFFLKTPFEDEAAELFAFYLFRYKVFPFKETDSENEFVDLIWEVVRKIKQFPDFKDFIETSAGIERENKYVRFIYTPAEIEILSRKLAIRSRSRGQNYFTEEDLKSVIKMDRPMLIAMRDSIEQMEEQSKFFSVI